MPLALTRSLARSYGVAHVVFVIGNVLGQLLARELRGHEKCSTWQTRGQDASNDAKQRTLIARKKIFDPSVRPTRDISRSIRGRVVREIAMDLREVGTCAWISERKRKKRTKQDMFMMRVDEFTRDSVARRMSFCACPLTSIKVGFCRRLFS